MRLMTTMARLRMTLISRHCWGLSRPNWLVDLPPLPLPPHHHHRDTCWYRRRRCFYPFSTTRQQGEEGRRSLIFISPFSPSLKAIEWMNEAGRKEGTKRFKSVSHWVGKLEMVISLHLQTSSPRPSLLLGINIQLNRCCCWCCWTLGIEGRHISFLHFLLRLLRIDLV